MASNKIDLPSWASKVYFSAANNSNSIQTLAKELQDVASKWFEVGLHLKFRPDPLVAIPYQPGQDTPDTKFRKILLYWMDNGQANYRTWDALANAVKGCGNVALANRITQRKDYVEGSKVVLNLDQLYAMLEQLVSSWKELSDGLRIPIWIRRKIDGKVTLKQCLTDVFEDWIVGTPEEATFEVLIRALDTSMVGNHALAMKASENVNILKLLMVPDTEPENKKIKEELEKHIQKLQAKDDAECAELQALSLPTTSNQALHHHTSHEVENELVENK